MANPFKEGEKRQKVAPGAPKVNPPVEPVVEEAPTPVPAAETSETTPMVGKEFLAKFVEPKSEGKSYSV